MHAAEPTVTGIPPLLREYELYITQVQGRVELTRKEGDAPTGSSASTWSASLLALLLTWRMACVAFLRAMARSPTVLPQENCLHFWSQGEVSSDRP